MAKEEKKEKYELSKHLEPYREYISNTGSLSIEEIMTRYHNEKHLAFSNAFLFTMAASVESQITLLNRLRIAGLLRKEMEVNRD